MAEALDTTILSGDLEDNQGRKLYPKTLAKQVAFEDGANLETRMQSLVTIGETRTAVLASGVSRLFVDLTTAISGLSSKVFFVDVLTSTAEGESPVASIYHELIGRTAVFYRQGVTVTKEITVTYRIVSINLYTQETT